MIALSVLTSIKMSARWRKWREWKGYLGGKRRISRYEDMVGSSDKESLQILSKMYSGTHTLLAMW